MKTHFYSFSNGKCKRFVYIVSLLSLGFSIVVVVVVGGGVLSRILRFGFYAILGCLFWLVNFAVGKSCCFV